MFAFNRYSLRKKGVDGIKQDVLHCIETAYYLRDEITKAGLTCRLNDLSCTVVLERPKDEVFVRKWQLACEEDIAHVVVMPNISREKIDQFVGQLLASTETFGRWTPARTDSPLSQVPPPLQTHTRTRTLAAGAHRCARAPSRTASSVRGSRSLTAASLPWRSCSCKTARGVA